MNLLLERTDSTNNIIEAADSLGIPHEMYASRKKQVGIFHGTIDTAEKVIKKSGIKCYASFENYDCLKYYSHFGEFLLNEDYLITTLSELNRRKWKIYSDFAKETSIFIRPTSSKKTMPAKVVDILDLQKYTKENEGHLHSPILISSVKNISWEGRFVVNKSNKIIGHSTYIFHGLRTELKSVPKESFDLCEKILSKVSFRPDDVFCLDLCKTEFGFSMIELTSFSSAGLYACDCVSILKNFYV